jgi:hypothetical protein
MNPQVAYRASPNVGMSRDETVSNVMTIGEMNMTTGGRKITPALCSTDGCERSTIAQIIGPKDKFCV